MGFNYWFALWQSTISILIIRLWPALFKFHWNPFYCLAGLKTEKKSFSSCNHKDRERKYSASITKKIKIKIQNKGETLLPGYINIRSNELQKREKEITSRSCEMQLSLPEHRLQELKARSIMHTSWIFIPAIITLRFLASQVYKPQRPAEVRTLSIASSCLQLTWKVTELWEMLWPFPIYIGRRMMSWDYRD